MREWCKKDLWRLDRFLKSPKTMFGSRKIWKKNAKRESEKKRKEIKNKFKVNKLFLYIYQFKFI